MERDPSGDEEHWVPERTRASVRTAGYSTRALDDMEPHVCEWDRWMRTVGEFCDYRNTDGFGRVRQMHRRTIMPAIWVCREWGSLLLDEKTVVACEGRECADWLASLFSTTNFWGRAQETCLARGRRGRDLPGRQPARNGSRWQSRCERKRILTTASDLSDCRTPRLWPDATYARRRGDGRVAPASQSPPLSTATSMAGGAYWAWWTTTSSQLRQMAII